MTSSVIPPIAASRTTAVVTETQATMTRNTQAQRPRVWTPAVWTLGDVLIAALSAVSLGFAVIGVVLAVS